MIANERQYRITKSEAEKFEQALARLDVVEGHRSPEMRRIMRDGMQSQLEELREQLAGYDALRTGRVAILELEGLRDLPAALIRARIACGLTQKQLAQRLGLKEQQVQRYEATRYSGVSLERIQQVADALGVKIREHLTMPSAGPRSPGGR